MNLIRTIALGGAAVLALAGAAHASQSTAQEQAQTRQLNLQQAGQQSTQTADADTVAVTPEVALNRQPELAPMALNSLSNPPTEIANARVVDDKGTTIGAVQKVDIAGGKPSRVEIALLGSQQIVALDAGALSYDKSDNVLTAGLDKNQIVQLPAQPRG